MTSEPQTESGLRLLAKSNDWHGADCGVRWNPSRGCNCGLLRSVIAIEQEAASKAVAEVLEIDQLVLAEALWNIYGPKFPNSTAEDWKSDASYLAALIASERTP